MTLAGFTERIEEWCAQRGSGFRDEDAMLDAHLYFTGITVGLATLDIESLKIDESNPAEATNAIFGQWNKKETGHETTERRLRER